jgi:hypothetical protein
MRLSGLPRSGTNPPRKTDRQGEPMFQNPSGFPLNGRSWSGQTDVSGKDRILRESTNQIWRLPLTKKMKEILQGVNFIKAHWSWCVAMQCLTSRKDMALFQQYVLLHFIGKSK